MHIRTTVFRGGGGCYIKLHGLLCLYALSSIYLCSIKYTCTMTSPPVILVKAKILKSQLSALRSRSYISHNMDMDSTLYLMDSIHTVATCTCTCTCIYACMYINMHMYTCTNVYTPVYGLYLQCTCLYVALSHNMTYIHACMDAMHACTLFIYSMLLW